MIKFAPRLDVFDQQASKWFQMVLNDSELFPCFVEKLRTKQYRFWRPLHKISFLLLDRNRMIPWHGDTPFKNISSLSTLQDTFRISGFDSRLWPSEGLKVLQDLSLEWMHIHLTSFNPSPIGTLLCLWESIFPLDSLGAFETIMRTTSTCLPHVVGDAEKDIKSRGT